MFTEKIIDFECHPLEQILLGTKIVSKIYFTDGLTLGDFIKNTL